MNNSTEINTSTQNKINNSKKIKGSVLVAYSAAAFGFMPVFAKYAYSDGANPLNFLAIRFLMAGVILTGIAIIRGEKLKLSLKEYISIAGMGVGAYSMVAFCYFFAITYIPASITSMLLYTFPIMVTVYAVLSGEEPFEYRKAFALVISFTGTLLILDTSWGGLNLVGVLLGLGSAVFYALYIILSNKLLKTISSVTTTTYMVWSAAVAFLLASLFTGNLNLDFGLVAWAGISGIVIISTVTGILAFLTGLEGIGPTHASILSMLEPLVTVVAAYLIFSEILTVVQVLGGGLILIAATLVQLPNKTNNSKFSENDL